MAIGFSSEIESTLQIAQFIELQILSNLLTTDPEKFWTILYQMIADAPEVPPNSQMLDTSSGIYIKQWCLFKRYVYFEYFRQGMDVNGVFLIYIKQWCLFKRYVYFEYFRQGMDVNGVFLLIETKINKLLDAL